MSVENVIVDGQVQWLSVEVITLLICLSPLFSGSVRCGYYRNSDSFFGGLILSVIGLCLWFLSVAAWDVMVWLWIAGGICGAGVLLGMLAKKGMERRR